MRLQLDGELESRQMRRQRVEADHAGVRALPVALPVEALVLALVQELDFEFAVAAADLRHEGDVGVVRLDLADPLKELGVVLEAGAKGIGGPEGERYVDRLLDRNRAAAAEPVRARS